MPLPGDSRGRLAGGRYHIKNAGRAARHGNGSEVPPRVTKPRGGQILLLPQAGRLPQASPAFGPGSRRNVTCEGLAQKTKWQAPSPSLEGRVPKQRAARPRAHGGRTPRGHLLSGCEGHAAGAPAEPVRAVPPLTGPLRCDWPGKQQVTRLLPPPTRAPLGCRETLEPPLLGARRADSALGPRAISLCPCGIAWLQFSGKGEPQLEVLHLTAALDDVVMRSSAAWQSFPPGPRGSPSSAGRPVPPVRPKN